MDIIKKNIDLLLKKSSCLLPITNFFFKETSPSYFLSLRRQVKVLILSNTSRLYIKCILFCDLKWYRINPVRYSFKANKTKALLVI